MGPRECGAGAGRGCRGMRATFFLLLQPRSPASDPGEVLEVDRARREEQKDAEEQSPSRAGG